MKLTDEQAHLRAEDTQFDEGKIKEVSYHEGSYSITMEGGIGFGFKGSYLGTRTPPGVGDMIRVYAGWGSTIRGVDLRGEPVFYKTPAQLEEEHKQWVADLHERKRREFEEQREKLDADYESLPPEFQRRISWFRDHNPDFRWDCEAYEMICCVDAMKIVNAVETIDGLNDFKDLPYEEQSKIGIDPGHSGNTFGMTLRLARLYLMDPILVVAEHAAMSPLSGCEKIGCHHPRPADVEEAVTAISGS